MAAVMPRSSKSGRRRSSRHGSLTACIMVVPVRFGGRAQRKPHADHEGVVLAPERQRLLVTVQVAQPRPCVRHADTPSVDGVAGITAGAVVTDLDVEPAAVSADAHL